MNWFVWHVRVQSTGVGEVTVLTVRFRLVCASGIKVEGIRHGHTNQTGMAVGEIPDQPRELRVVTIILLALMLVLFLMIFCHNYCVTAWRDRELNLRENLNTIEEANESAV